MESPIKFGDHSPDSWSRSVKRRHDNEEDESSSPKNENRSSTTHDLNPRVHIENERDILRETVNNQQQSIQDLYEELEEERNASSTAASEAMSMIQRLQNEKAELQMELRQYKLYAGEKMEHDQQEIIALEDLVNQREQTILALTCETQAYKHRMMSYGLTEAEADGENKSMMLSRNTSVVETSPEYEHEHDYDLPVYEYPPLKCNVYEEQDAMEADIYVDDDENYPPTDSPRGRKYLKTLDLRISEMETNPGLSSQLNAGGGIARANVTEKVVVGQSQSHSPRPDQRHFKRISTVNSSSHLAASSRHDGFVVDSPRLKSFKKGDNLSYTEKYESSDIGDDMVDRVYTIDSVHQDASHSGETKHKLEGDASDGNVVFTGEQMVRGGDPDITKLYTRLQALEADRESMKQALLSMRTEKAQMVLLKEIAQHLSKEVVPHRRLPLRKASIARSMTFTPVFKWITSFVSWRRKARRSKYMFGMSAKSIGLQMLLEKVPRSRKWRCLRSTQV
ncbi:unnamed protein product [Cochlearia groenlandica]